MTEQSAIQQVDLRPCGAKQIILAPTPQHCTRTPDSTNYLQEFCVHANHQPMQGKGKREGKKERTCRIGCHHPITHTQVVPR